MHVETSGRLDSDRIELTKPHIRVEGDALVIRDGSLRLLFWLIAGFCVLMMALLAFAATGPNPPEPEWHWYGWGVTLTVILFCWIFRDTGTTYWLRPRRLEKTFHFGPWRRSRRYDLAPRPFVLAPDFYDGSPIFHLRLADGKERRTMLSKVGGLTHDQLLALMNRVADRGVKGLTIVMKSK